MSATKNQPSFDRLLEQAREYDDLSHERFAEELYLNNLKRKIPPTENKEQVTPPKGTNTNQHNGTRKQ